MSYTINRVGGSGGSGEGASILVTGIPQTGNVVTATKGTKTRQGTWQTIQVPNPAYHNLPSGFTEVESITSNGTQYINTGIVGNQDTHYNLKIKSCSNGCYMFGAWASNYNSGSLAFNPSTGTLANLYCGYGNQYMDVTSPITSYPLEVDMNKNVLSLNGETYRTFTQNTFSTTYPLLIFAENRAGNIEYDIANVYCHMEVTSCEIYDNGTLARRLIPCHNDNTNKYGLLDISDPDNPQFYGDANGGDFTAGAIVPATLSASGYYVPNIDEYGTWTVSATDGTHSASQTVTVDMLMMYEIEMSYVPKSGLIAEWLFGGDLNDTSGQGNNLTNNGVTIQASGLSGLPSSAYFSGSTYANASSGVLPTNSPFTLSVWVKASNTTYNTVMATSVHNNRSGFQLRHSCFAATNGSSTTTYLDASSWFTGSWKHIVVTSTGDTTTNGAKLYVDGTLVNTVTPTGALTSHANNLYLGRVSYSSSNMYIGSLAGIRIYNRVLTADEVTMLYSGGQGV